jgi:ABC-type bacteriocin/lantibiotic exporter with double-glycine peptidase domain
MFSNITKLYNFLDYREKKSLYIFIIFSLIIATLEAAVLFVIFPLILIIFNMAIGSINENSFFLKYLDIYYLKEKQNFILTAALLFVVFKSFFFYLIKTFQLKLIFNIVAKYQKKTLLIYLNQQYNFFTQRKSSDLTHYVNGEAVNFSMNFVGQTFLLISELIIIIILLSFLLFINVNLFFLVSIFILFSFFFFNLFLKKKLLLLGITRQKIEQDRSHYLYELFRGIKEIFMDNLVKNFYKKIKNNINLSNSLNGRLLSYNFLPRSIFEIITFTILASFIIFNNYLKDTSLFYTFISFIYITYRIIPNLLGIVSANNLINYSKESFVKIKNEFERLELRYNLRNKRKYSTVKQILIKGLYYKYLNTNKYIFKDFNLKIKNNDKIFISGNSGVGKTTLINLICGLLKPTKGTILFDDKIINNYKNTRDNISIISQNFNILNTTIKSNIILNQPYDKKKFTESVKFSGFKKLNNKKHNYLVGENGIKLSGGQRQRLLLARALYADKQIIIFDEGLNALENKSRNKILRKLLNLNGKIIIYLGHEKNNNTLFKKFKKIHITNQ